MERGAIVAAARIVAVNVVLGSAFLGLLLLTPPTFAAMRVVVTHVGQESEEADASASLPNFESFPWASDHFREYSLLTEDYFDYFGWRRRDFDGATITITGGLRMTIEGAAADGPSVAFFGGSTIWGYGVDDANTIPSVFSRRSGRPAENLGEDGWRSRQSLAFLEHLVLRDPDWRDSPRDVVFYDGVNDIERSCRAGADLLSTTLEGQFRTLLATASTDEVPKWSYRRLFGQSIDFIAAASASLAPEVDDQQLSERSRFYDCHRDEEKAEAVARQLVETWVLADRVAHTYGHRFTAILQPVASVGAPRLDHLAFSRDHRELLLQYPIVYDHIRRLAAERDIRFVDLSDAYDGAEFIYFDFCHVSPQGHERIVSRLLPHLSRHTT